jgi:predicted ester cyclase
MTIIHLIDDEDPHICGGVPSQSAQSQSAKSKRSVKPCSSKDAFKPMESIVKAIVFAAALTSMSFATQSAAAETPEQAALAVVAPFYDGLNAAPGKDVAAVLRRATAPEWVSCGANDVCGAREQVIAAIAGRHKAIPDLKWEIKEVLVSGNRVTVRGEATGTPAGEFMGVPHGGKSFKLMSIDVHTIEGEKIVRSYHVEDWLGAVRQLSAK